jgi:transcriptional regulator with XRE-family HTH domain
MLCSARAMAGERGSGRASEEPGETPQFGRVLRQYRLAAGLTQDALAEKAGLSARGIADLERGARRFPHADTIERLAKALELSPSERSALTNIPRQSPGERSTASMADAAMASQPPRSPFVGRTSELQLLHNAFLAAAALNGGTAMIAGEPGIGKTALCERFAELVRVEGGLPLIGHCYEEGSLSLPYLPFLEALRAYTRVHNPLNLLRDLGSGAAELARLLPELSEQLDLHVSPPGDAREDRWRLLSSVSEFLRAAAARQPLVLILEDLHDADDATLDLLLHLARTLQSARLLILGTYRDAEVDRMHPFSGALAELRRIAPVQRLTLRGLSIEHVQALVEAMQVRDATPELVQAIQHQTEGNPLFVQEVARYLIEQLERSPIESAAAVLAHVPEGLRDVIGKRLSGLSASTNRLLGAASVIGRDFRLDVLQQLVSIADEDLYIALQEAVAGAVLEEHSSAGATASYRFTHALFRQALYEELIAPRRIRLHQQVARALAKVYARHPAEHAAELAQHYAFCSEPEEIGWAVTYGQEASRRAVEVYACGEAVRLLERALQVEEVLDPDDARHCDLLLALGEAMLPMDQPGKVARSVAEEAFTLASKTADMQRAGAACILALRALFRDSGQTSRFATREVRGWLQRADHYAADGTAERVHTDCYWGLHHIAAGDPARGQDCLRGALSRARALGDFDVYLIAATFGVSLVQTIGDSDLIDQLAWDLYGRQAWPRMGMDRCYALASMAFIFIGGGNRDAGLHVSQQVWDLARATNDISVTLLARVLSAWHALVDGRLDEAALLGVSAADEADRRGVRLAASSAVARAISARALYYLGRSGELDVGNFESTRSSLAKKALVLSFVGRCRETAVIRHGFGAIGDADDQTSMFILGDLLEVAIRCHDLATIAALVGRLSPLPNRLQPAGLISFGRLLGDGSVLLGRADDARAYYQQAIELCRAVRFLPELALSQLAMAELLLTYNYAEDWMAALAHLDAATTAFREMQMQPSLDRALGLASRAHVGPGTGGPARS